MKAVPWIMFSIFFIVGFALLLNKYLPKLIHPYGWVLVFLCAVFCTIVGTRWKIGGHHHH